MYRRKSKRFKSKRNYLSRSWYFCLPLTAIILLVWVSTAAAQDNPPFGSPALKTIWMLVAASLVFFMNAGFAMLEAGFCRYRNAVNVLAKNLIVFCVASLAFWVFGFSLMFGDSGNGLLSLNGLFFEIDFPNPGNPQPFPSGFDNLKEAWPGRSFTSLFFFQLVFAGTAATIVSGAVAERIKFLAFILFSALLVGFLYPFTGHWVWGINGWLKEALNFQDFAGSTVVHSVGGTAALVGAWLLKPRNRRFGYNNKTDKFEAEKKGAEKKEAEKKEERYFRPHNLSLSTLGCLILWLGWFGFNGGSSQYLETVPHIITTTMISGATGGIAVLCFSEIFSTPTLSSIINGILGGLVGITASSAFVNIKFAFIIGVVSGLVVLLAEFFLKEWKIDDPVGAVPVHLFCGLWGTIAVGIFSDPQAVEYTYKYPLLQQTFYQFLGWLLVCAVTAILSLIAWISIGIVLHYYTSPDRNSRPNQRFNLASFILELFKIGRKGIRVSPENEKQGSDGFFQNP